MPPPLPNQVDNLIGHNSAVQQAESVRQTATAAAGANQAAVNAAHVAYYRTVQASAVANGLTSVIASCNVALAALGAQGL